VAIEFRWAEGRFDRLPALAADLVRRQVAVIVALGGNNSILAAKAATDTIPIIFISGSDPVRLGLVTSLSRPTGNITGYSFFAADIVAKQFGLLRDLVPDAKVVGLIINADSPESREQRVIALEAAPAFAFEVAVADATTASEFDQVFATLVEKGASAIVVGADPLFSTRIAEIVALAARHRIPTMYFRREYAAAGGLMSYGTSLTDAYRHAAIYVGRILKGAKPADLPVMRPTKFEFVINLNTARAFGLSFPPGLLAIADEVIE
jgi:putative tryptophan/tyrosine transport system substrate-binding protein